MILDSTCSTLKRWPEFADVRMDIKADVKPDIVADAKHLPFQDHVFDEIYCDPPHMIRSDPPETWGGFWRNLSRFGTFHNRESWLAFLGHTNNEFARVLKDEGILRLKITDGKEARMTRLNDVWYMN